MRVRRALFSAYRKEGLLPLAEAVRRYGGRLIFASTVWVYMLADREDVTEDTPLLVQNVNHPYTASKVAAVAIILRMATLGTDALFLVQALVVLSICSMTLGNLAAIVQRDLKRLLAYSSISHAGYVLIGVLSMSANGFASAIFYALAYLVMNLSCFLVVVKVASDGSDLKIAQLAGLHRRSPLLALVLMLAVFGLPGIPPTVGFTGKFLVFVAAVEQGYLWLVIVAMVNATISLYYYIMVVKAAYLTEPESPPAQLAVSGATRVLAGVLVTVMVAAGVFPNPILEVARAAARSLM